MGIGDYQPKTGRFLRENGQLINLADVGRQFDGAGTPFKDLRTIERRLQFDLKSIYGINRRDRVVTEGSGTVTNTIGDGEYTVATTANGSDRALLESAERGRYVAGTLGQAGLGVRVPSTSLAGNQVIRWGYFDATDGFGFGVDATGLFLFTRRAGVDTLVRQADWNADPLDGSGLSQITLDPTEGQVYQIDFLWYGYGPIAFEIVDSRALGDARVVVVHRARIEGGVSVNNPNLPLSVEVDNAGTATAAEVKVAGRQFSSVGGPANTLRSTSEFKLAVSGIGTTAVPLVSFRRKDAYQGAEVLVDGFDVVTDGNTLLEIYEDATLTGSGSPMPAWGTPTGATDTETALVSDTEATGLSGGDLIYRRLIGSSGAGGNAIGLANARELIFNLHGAKPVTFALRAASGTVTASLVARMTETW